MAYDLFGNGKTSLKGNVGRYLHPASNQGRYINANPSELVSTITTRPWTDNNGNYWPDCDLLNGQPQSPATTGSIDTCGVFSDLNFGRARAGHAGSTTRFSAGGARVRTTGSSACRCSRRSCRASRWRPVITGGGGRSTPPTT